MTVHKTARVEHPVTRSMFRKLPPRTKAAFKWTFDQTAKYLGICPSQLRYIMQGKRFASAEVCAEYRRLETDLLAAERSERLAHRGEVVIIYDGRLPSRIYLCKCGRWFTKENQPHRCRK